MGIYECIINHLLKKIQKVIVEIGKKSDITFFH